MAEDEFDEKMTNADYQALLYSRDRLSLLQKGLTAVLNAMQGVLAVQDDLASGGMMSIKSAEHAKQLEQIDKDCWERIRVELLDVYKSFKKRASIPGTEINGNDVKDKSAAECLLGLTERVDDVKKGLDTRLKVTAKREENMIKEVRLLQEQLYDERQQSVELKWKAQEATENAGKYTVPVLQQQLKEKQEEISQLKRNSTVQLWDKEKAKLIEGYKTREEKLTKELADTRKRFEDMKEKLTEKLRETEEKLKMQKMKDALDKKIINRNVSKSMESINSSSSERNRRDNVAGDLELEIEGLKRKIYSKEKDIARLEEEIINQQRLAVGCFKGIQKDFKILCTRQEQNKYKKVDSKRFRKILNAIFDGAKRGQLDITKADLPLQYIALPEDLIGHPIKRSSGKSILLSKQDIRHHLTPVGNEGPSPPSSPDASPSSSPRTSKKKVANGERKLQPIEGSEDNEKEEAKDVMVEDPGMAFRKATNVRKRRESRASLTFQHLPHPDLVDISNAHLDIEVALKQFPELTETQIKDHYDQFRRYDTSGDLLLDFTEVVRAIQSTVGNFYSPAQVKEAMNEIDSDKNDTVDFYEYLTIALMVTNKRGRSEVFRSGIVKHGGQSVSKLCAIQ
ncbi:myosin-9-like isoform X1 [Lytechinus pictus]|uniref:myosin-9-like isoform X1 n=1 Tax=Lytechinus pictus TaxID=7653 RepID=UPI0030BA1B0D